MNNNIKISKHIKKFIQWQKQIAYILIKYKYKPTLKLTALKLFNIINNLLLMILPIKLLMIANHNNPSAKFPWLPIEEKNKLVAIIFLIIILLFIISKILIVYNKKIINKYSGEAFGLEKTKNHKILADYYNRLCNLYSNLSFTLLSLFILWLINKPVFFCLFLLPLAALLFTKYIIEGQNTTHVLKKLKGLATYRTDIFIEIASSSIFIVSFGVLVIAALTPASEKSNILLLLITFIILRRGISSLTAIAQNIIFTMKNNIINKLEALHITQLLQEEHG